MVVTSFKNGVPGQYQGDKFVPYTDAQKAQLNAYARSQQLPWATQGALMDAVNNAAGRTGTAPAPAPAPANAPQWVTGAPAPAAAGGAASSPGFVIGPGTGGSGGGGASGSTGTGGAAGGATGGSSSSGGLIAGAAGGGTNAATERAALERAQLERWNVDAPQTVQGQLQGILQRGSPLMERARTQALQGANERGILNSTMAGEAGQAALIDRALEIARPDAATNAAAGQFNAGAANDMSRFNAGSANDTSRFNAGQANQMASDNANRNLDWAKTNYNGQLQKALAQMDIDSKRELTILDGQIKKDLAKVEADFKTAMQTSQSAAGLYSDAIRSITTIMVDPKLDDGAKQNLTNQLIGSVTDGLRLINAVGEVEGLDAILADIRNFGSTTGSATSAGTTGGSTGGGAYGVIDYNAPGYAP
jgi:hypothetical protein